MWPFKKQEVTHKGLTRLTNEEAVKVLFEVICELQKRVDELEKKGSK